MCLYTGQEVAYVAKCDIICYKVLKYNKRVGFRSSIQNFPYDLDTTYKTDLLKVRFYNGEHSITDGFHSYISMDGLSMYKRSWIHKLFKRYKKYTLVECIIPQGSQYYIGLDGSYDLCYTSDTIIIKKVL